METFQDAVRTVDLGFAEVELPPGTHICQIYSDEDERNEALLEFLAHGIKAGESTACFSHRLAVETVRSALARHGLDLDQSLRSGIFSFSEAEEVYFRGERFDPDFLLHALETFHTQATRNGYSAARVIGEMLPDILSRPGGERLLEYECRVNLLLREHPMTTVCQYHAGAFDGATIMDILKLHPMMIVRGAVVHNPFYMTPENYLSL